MDNQDRQNFYVCGKQDNEGYFDKKNGQGSQKRNIHLIKEPQEDKRKVCSYFTNGNCRNGERCRYLHPEGGGSRNEQPKFVALGSKSTKADQYEDEVDNDDHVSRSPLKKTNPKPKPSKSKAKIDTPPLQPDDDQLEQEQLGHSRNEGKSNPVLPTSGDLGVTISLDTFECIDKELHDRLLSEDIQQWPILDEISAKTVAAVLLRCKQFQDFEPLISYIKGLTVNKNAVVLRLNDCKEAQDVLSKLGLKPTPPFYYNIKSQTFLVLERYQELYVLLNVRIYNTVLYTSHQRFIMHKNLNLKGKDAFHLSKLSVNNKKGCLTELSTSLFDLEVGLPYFRSHCRAQVLLINGDRAVFAKKRYTDKFINAALWPLRRLSRGNKEAANQFNKWLADVRKEPKQLSKCLVEELAGDAEAFKASFIGNRKFPRLNEVVLDNITKMKKVVELGVKRGVTWAEPEWRIIGGTSNKDDVLNPPGMVETIREEIHEEGNISMEESKKLIDENTPYYDVLIDGFEVGRMFVAPLPNVLANGFMGSQGERGLLRYAEFKKNMGKYDGMFLSDLEQHVDENPLLKSFLAPSWTVRSSLLTLCLLLFKVFYWLLYWLFYVLYVIGRKVFHWVSTWVKQKWQS